MIYSRDIVQDKRFPDFIRLSSFFTKEKTYRKIFPEIGLPNFKCKLTDISSNVKFAFKEAWLGLKIDTQDWRCWAPKKAAFSALGFPLFIADMFVSLVEAKEVQRELANRNLNIVFSSDDINGAWDIATMSMRGIDSCQSWHSRRAHHLIGSITDPCCAIMYVEDQNDSSGYGTRMLYRTIVRYVVHEQFGPHLFMEQLYPYTEDESMANAITTLFALTLSQRSKMNVLFRGIGLNSKELYKYIVIPQSEPVVNNLYSQSYRDSHIPYKSVNNLFNKFPTLASFKEKFFN